MDLVTAEPAPSRRSLMGALGAVGAAAVAGVLTPTRSVAATPNAPTPADVDLLTQAMRLELTARDLYRATLGNVDGDEEMLMRTIAENHEAYAHSIAGIAGLSADDRDDALYDSLVSSFDRSDLTEIALSAYGLEQTAVATHTALLGEYESIDAVELTASIVVVEARHATVLADLAGQGDDLDALLTNTAQPLDLAGGANP